MTCDMWQTRKMESIFKLKDKNAHTSHVIYKGKCTCGQTYIGETACNLKVRVNEHSDFNKQLELAKQIRKHPNHKFSWEVLTTAHSWLKRNKRSVLHRMLPSRTKQTSAIAGPHLVPHGNRYYITGITWTIRTLSVCILFHSDDDQTDRKC